MENEPWHHNIFILLSNGIINLYMHFIKQR